MSEITNCDLCNNSCPIDALRCGRGMAAYGDDSQGASGEGRSYDGHGNFEGRRGHGGHYGHGGHGGYGGHEGHWHGGRGHHHGGYDCED